ncbi:halogenase [Lysobacter pythonis]|uniref:Halogenase n=1 Tax=Solilutibacter pythonis TaxID=2483112 RepID=A0A3M2HY61_9GAMM|nr:tryptophan 7-halogenase [Lysobacter pythonis]RMH93185.1 halogenase [Lysobacter pythonis]
MTGERCDVVILGGGLAGMTLALQLRRQDAALRIRVLERRAHPVPEAAHKVGESTVEIGAHYFAQVLGLLPHLKARHIRKFGFRFFFSEGARRIDRCTELGVSMTLPTPSWQIDRGRFENFLGAHLREAGIGFVEGACVREVSLADDDAPHRVRYAVDGVSHEIEARWVVDATGRAGLLKRQLGLAQPNDHDVNSAWWRVEGFVDPDTWSDDAGWHARCDPPERWRSTNHLCGPGYWVWLIPLSSGAHSVGIVADEAIHPLASINTHDKAMAWLDVHQPRLAASLRAPGHAVLDFRFLRHFSHECAEVFSPRRWALTGESGFFADPFYSPGSDIIAISNTYVAELIRLDRGGQPITLHAALFQQLYRGFYDNTMSLYRGQYALFGNAEVMPVKVIWDYTFYWALLAPLYMSGRIAELTMLGRLRPWMERATQLNAAMQPLLRAWGEASGYGTPEDGRLLDQHRIGWFHELNRALGDALDDDRFAARIAGNVGLMARLAAEIRAKATARHPDIDTGALAALLAGVSPPVEPMLSAEWYPTRA